MASVQKLHAICLMQMKVACIYDKDKKGDTEKYVKTKADDVKSDN